MTTTHPHAHTPHGLRPGALRPDLEHREAPDADEGHLQASSLALRKAWGAYFVLAALPPLAMIGAIFFLILTPSRGPDVRAVEAADRAGWYWFLAGMVWISIWVPVSFYIRRRYWHAYYEGGLVEPRDYLKGDLAIWLPLVVAGVIGFIGFASTQYVANLFTSITAFLVFLTMFPNGHAMTRPVGDHDDPGVYEEPK